MNSRTLAAFGSFGFLAVATQACLVKVNDNNIILDTPTERVCDKFAQCGVLDSNGFTFTYGSCLGDYPEGTFSTSCANAVESSSCASLYDGTSSALDLCFDAPPVGDPVTRFCNRLIACGALDKNGNPYNSATCEEVYGTLLLPSGCPSAVESATCNDINNPNSQPYFVCFPVCSVTKCGVDGESLDLCRSGFLYTYDCNAECALSGKSYTGFCGTSYQGQMTSTGEPDCWCQ